MATDANLEVLMSEYDALNRLGDFMESADPRGWIRQSNRLLDACIDAGMGRDEPNHEAWAAQRVTRFLLAA
jgi:hypothetical protein